MPAGSSLRSYYSLLEVRSKIKEPLTESALRRPPPPDEALRPLGQGAGVNTRVKQEYVRRITGVHTQPRQPAAAGSSSPSHTFLICKMG